MISKKKAKGFSLIELVVSMLVVSIAMLGFASLLAFSTRTVNTNYTKKNATDILQSTSNLFVQNRKLIEKAMTTDGVRIIDCSANNIIFDNNTSALNDALFAICTGLDNIPNVEFEGDLARANMIAEVTRTTIDDLFVDIVVRINLAYQTVKNDSLQKATDNNIKIDTIVHQYCPLGGNGNDADHNTRRIENSVVCESLEVEL